jgi:tRNA modification GTPase
MDTIFALASGRGRAGVAVIRISGPQAHAVVAALTGSVPPVRQASLRKLVWDGEILDTALVLTFAEGASFTGQESAELHVHGGLAVMSAVMQVLSMRAGVRMAEPGEFTRRALENGRMELHEVEGLADLIDAETEAQRKQAQRLLSGDFQATVDRWRDDLQYAAALIEATVDFADEDVPQDVWPEVKARLGAVHRDLLAQIAGSFAAERVRHGFDVAIIGPPNVGKSTLINRLSGRDAVMTSSLPGTTRDVIEVRMDLAGLPVTLIDTAGLRETVDPLEAEGIRRARMRAAAADLRVLVLDQAEQDWDGGETAVDLRVSSKADLGWHREGWIAISAQTGEGVDDLIAAIIARLGGVAGTAGIILHQRHREVVQRATQDLANAMSRIATTCEAELVARDVRSSCAALEGMIGRIGVEDLLGTIFGRFCIGK